MFYFLSYNCKQVAAGLPAYLTADNLSMLLVVCIYNLIVIRCKWCDLCYISRVLLYHYSHANDKVYISYVWVSCAHVGVSQRSTASSSSCLTTSYHSATLSSPSPRDLCMRPNVVIFCIQAYKHIIKDMCEHHIHTCHCLYGISAFIDHS